jgi:hypothetical protein
MGRKFRLVVCWGVSVAFLLSACGGNGKSKSPAIISPVAHSVVDSAPDDACPNGGITVLSGMDRNGNGSLDESEITATQYICHGNDGQDGLTALVATVAEPAGANCANGGRKVNVGLDANGNSALDTAEITSSSYICNGASGADGTDGANGADGADGANGADGADGANGADGADGTNGADGSNSLIAISAEPAGANCPNGGRKVDVGLDLNNNKALDAEEMTTNYICNGLDGFSSLVSVVDEPAGANCAYGGKKITTWLDTIRNNTLDAGEVSATDYVCHGAGYNAPIANAGPDQRVAAAGVEVNLDGSSSSDPSGSELTYQWSFMARPVGSLAALSSTGVTPKFTPDKAGKYELSLVVRNETAASLPDTVTVWAGMPIPDTGQTQYYSTTFGDDGDYTINPMSFTDNGDGTILDNVTGLTWQKCSLGQSGVACATGTATTRTWEGAQTACENLGPSWRLPTRLELLTIVNYRVSFPAIDRAYFPQTPLSYLFWSSTPYAPNANNAWKVNFNAGITGNYDKTGNGNVRCVRGE